MPGLTPGAHPPDAPESAPAPTRWEFERIRPALCAPLDGPIVQVDLGIWGIPGRLQDREVLTSAEAPGLGLQAPIDRPSGAVRAGGPWVLVHLSSGRLVTDPLPDLAVAQGLARQLATYVDWTLLYPALRDRIEAEPGLAERIAMAALAASESADARLTARLIPTPPGVALAAPGGGGAAI